MTRYTELVDTLRSRYRRAHTDAPAWAWPLPPSIPFVGKSYPHSEPRVAVYAATADSPQQADPLPAILRDERAWNRHRAAFEQTSEGFFPRVDIAPVDGGGLLCAALFLVRHLLGERAPPGPQAFLEELVVASCEKYAVRERDAAGAAERLSRSLDFLRADFETLAPEWLLIPGSVHRHAAVRRLLAETLPRARVLPVPQFVPMVLHVHLRKHRQKAVALQKRCRGSLLTDWTERIRGYRQGYPYRYYVAVESAWHDLERGR